MTIEPRSSRYRRRQINHLATDGVLAKDSLRRGTFRSVPALIAAIRAYVRAHNTDPRPFIWTASASAILRKIKRCKEALETGH